MASTTFTSPSSSSDHHLHHLPPSSSSHRPSPPVPVRSVLRPKTSASTITTTNSANLAVEPQRHHRPRPLDMQSSTATTTTLERPSTSPSPRQSYFERYPTRNGKGKEKTANDQGATTGAPADHPPHSLSSKSSIDGMASARAKAARERAKALTSRLSAAHSDQEGPSAAASSSKTPSPAGVAVAFPTVDDPSSHDDADVDEEDPHHGGGATTSSSAAAASTTTPANDYGSRRPRQISEASSSSNNPVRIVSAGVHRGHHREKSSGGHYRPTITTNNSGAGAYPNRPPREHVPRSQAYHHLTNFPTQSSSSSRAGFAPTPDLLPFIRTSTSSTYTQTTLADQDPEFITPLSTPKSSLYRADGVLVAGYSNGVGVETMDALVQGMNGGADTTDDTDYLTSMFGRRSKKDKRGASSLAGAGLLGSSGTKLKYHPLYHPPLPQPPDGISLGAPKAKARKEGSTTEDDRSAPSNPASASVSSSEREKERERRPRKVSASGQTPFPSGSHHHRPTTAKSDITIKHGSRSVSGPFDDVEVPTRKAHSRPSTREKDRDRPRSSRHRDRERVRGSRDYHHHRKQHEASSSNSSPREQTRDLPIDLSSPQPTPVLEKPPEAPKAPIVVPSISDIIRTHAPGYAARPKRSNGPAHHPPSSFTGFAGAPITTSRRSSLVEEDDEPAARSSIDSIAAEVQESLRKSSTRFASASGRMEQQSRESSDDYDETGSRRVSLASPTQTHSKRPFPVVSRKTLQHAKSFGDRPRSVVVSETPVLSSANSYRSPRSEGGAHSVIGIGIGGPPRPASRAASVYSGPAPSLAPSTPLSLGTPGITFTGGNTATQDPTKLELAQFLRSPRLTRLMTLRRHPHAGLTVSMADVGSPTGHPVIVYLGLGCVRYLIALYDEMAEALGLRLVCVDRWGLGRTGEPTTENGRGLLEWAAVIEEVADTLGLEMYSVIAHSAGAPYALAGVLKCGDRRLKGSVHLLAPWVSMSVDTGYKWLKYVPNGLIKTAQAAEWKVQGWMLGKPPTITYQGIEYDAAAAAAAEKQQEHEEYQDNALQRTLSPPHDIRSSTSTSSYDDLGDFDGKYESCSTLGRRAGARNQPVSSTKSGKKKPVKSILSIFNNNPHSASSSVRDGSSTRSSRANSLAGGSSVKTLPGPGLKKSPKLKGLKSLSSLRTEARMAEVTRHSSDPMLSTGPEQQQRPSLLSHQSQPEVASSSAPPNVTVGLGIGMDDEMMEWGARLNMLEEISPPTPPSSTNGRKSSGATGGGSSESGRGRRSVSLTGGRPAFLKDIVPPVPPLPTSPCLSVEHPHSPNTSITSSTVTGSTAVAPRKAPMSLANALLRASHAESLKGGTADLLAILERDSKPWGFSYADVRHPVKVWYGDRDEKIAISSVRWMERVMRDCTVTIVKGANHNLMTNADVVVEVLESIAKEWSEDQPVSPTGARLPMISASTSSLSRRKGRY